ncbi:CST complex subunit CTC1 isoform X2 [Prosopis cineraria]|uniref:CST complex subunit CTC1 isoform X2 n=1 Tax=Prosopis cineraria TaxID=364024 RepID=UPI00240FD3C4|nr:CST complex subunit CTC1 isoform X2 [Prosopis cineraria]
MQFASQMDDAMEDHVKIVKISELVEGARPLTSTASLNVRSSSRSLCHNTSSSSISSPNTVPRVLTALKHPTIVVGTLTLPSLNSGSSSGCPCFQFSDGTCTVCCDVLGLDAYVIGKEIRVYAWNFISCKRGKGFLEIIKWGFLDSSNDLRKQQLDQSNHLDSYPLVPSRFSGQSVSFSSGHRVYGVLESVRPLTVVPCTMLASGSKRPEDWNSSSSRNLMGFLVEVICCQCRLCSSKTLPDLSCLMADRNTHSFTKLVDIYFVDHASSWHPVITKLSGNCIVISGLKRKLVFMGKEESCIMYVTTNESALHVRPYFKQWLPCFNMDTKGKRKFSTYTGILRGVYMQGMVVELDHDVWLLLTDQKLTLPHSLRVGAIISVRNVHFVDPKFPWTKILILGACLKSSIVVESFSPFQTECHIIPQSSSMLGKFIESLPFAARLWVLLLVSSLRKKFGGVLSNMDLLGSNHREGLAQMFAQLQLPSSVFQTQRGAFTGLCGHDSFGCGRELHCGSLKLVIPMSIFACHCKATIMRMLRSGNDCKLLKVDNHLRLLSGEVSFRGHSVRRIISSEDVGCLLLGYLKIAPSTGRLQLVDATGSIDVLIPDLPLTWDPSELYEVMDYNIIMDGIPELVDHLEFYDTKTLSCGAIFNCKFTQATKDLSILIHAHFLWKNVKCRNFPLYFYPSMKNESKILEPGNYHLLRVSHKFPQLQKMSSTSSTFIEALLLPWNLLLTGQDGNQCSKGLIKKHKENGICGYTDGKEQVPIKRQKLVNESKDSLLKDEAGYSICEFRACSSSFSNSEQQGPINLSSHQIPCQVTFRNIPHKNINNSAILQSTSSVVEKGADSQQIGRKIFVEISSESFLNYQIGDFYAIKHYKKDCFCTLKDAQSGSSVKVLDSLKYLWSLSFLSDEGPHCHRSADSSTKDILSPSNNGVLLKDGNAPGISSDVCLHIPANLKDLLDYNFLGTEGQGQTSAISDKNFINSLTTEAFAASFPQSSGCLFPSCLFPEGNLISLQGHVIGSHDVSSSMNNSCLSRTGLNALQLKGSVGARSSLCIHVLVDRHIVKIFGLVRKHAFPTGFGPGVCATFHRILDMRGHNEFLLLPVSFIAIKSVILHDEPNSDRPPSIRPTYTCDASGDTLFSGLISELNQCPSHKQTWLRCRVVAVFVLVLERNATGCDLRAKNNALVPLFDISLAGFVLDDGSSPCCCWTNGDRAATLLRLHEKLPKSGYWSLKLAGISDNTSSTAADHLVRILKTHKGITVKNYGSCFKLASQNHVVSAIHGEELCRSDERLLKFIVFNSCFGRPWNVVGSVMNAEEVDQIKKEYHVEMEIMRTMPNIWAREVCYMNTLTEARNMARQF